MSMTSSGAGVNVLSDTLADPSVQAPSLSLGTFGSLGTLLPSGTLTLTTVDGGTQQIMTTGMKVQDLITELNSSDCWNLGLLGSYDSSTGSLNVMSQVPNKGDNIQASFVTDSTVTSGNGRGTALNNACLEADGTLGTFTSESDVLSAGSLTINDTNAGLGITGPTITLNTDTTVDGLISAINSGNMGVTAGYDSSQNVIYLSSNNGTVAVFPVSTTIGDLTTGGGDSEAVSFSGGFNASDVSSLDTVTQTSGGASNPNAAQVITVAEPDGSDPTDADLGECGLDTNPTGTLVLTVANPSPSTVEDVGVNVEKYGDGLDFWDIGGYSNSTLGQAGWVDNEVLGRTDNNTADYFTLTAPSYNTVGAITINSTLGLANEGGYATGEITGIAAGGKLSGLLTVTMPDNWEGESTDGNSLRLDSSESLTQQANDISAAGLGVTATAETNGNGTQYLLLTSNVEGAAGDFTVNTTDIEDPAPAGASLSYTPSTAYSIGLSNDATNSVYDSDTSQSSNAAATFTSGSYSTSGVATISYSAKAGQNLSSTDLLNATDAQTALTALNSAIKDVAAQDGYIGSQINTLGAISQVLGTQMENVQAAQNAVQATDYASVTSDMAKYEILMQTGISALAQANVVQQEVTKLLQ
jgi:flagellin-like hook-associated protein FlgL